VQRKALILTAALAFTATLAVGLVAAQPPADPIGDTLAKTPPPSEEAPPPSKETQIVVPPAAPVLPEEQPKVAAAPPKAAPATPSLTKRTRYPAAVVQTLDKVTAESMRFEVRIGQPKRYKNLIFTVRSCEVTAPDEPARDAVAYFEVDSQPKPEGRSAPPAKEVFRGWLFAASPSVNPIQHPVYDAWLIACKA